MILEIKDYVNRSDKKFVILYQICNKKHKKKCPSFHSQSTDFALSVQN